MPSMTDWARCGYTALVLVHLKASHLFLGAAPLSHTHTHTHTHTHRHATSMPDARHAMLQLLQCSDVAQSLAPVKDGAAHADHLRAALCSKRTVAANLLLKQS